MVSWGGRRQPGDTHEVEFCAFNVVWLGGDEFNAEPSYQAVTAFVQLIDAIAIGDKVKREMRVRPA